MVQTILVTGATGKQGGAVVKSLVEANKAAGGHLTPRFRILALTRTPASPAAVALKNYSNVEIVRGDLDHPEELFKQLSTQYGSIDGVFSVQAVLTGGVTPDAEEKQGKGLAEVAAKYNVGHFVYSSVERGASEDMTDVPHFKSKARIEMKIKELPMKWTILRPVFFMENITPDLQGKMIATAWSSWLGKDRRLQLVSVIDIGHFARMAFENPEQYANQAIPIAGDEKSLDQMDFVFLNQFAYAMPRTFAVFGSAMTYMMPDMGVMFKWFRDEGYGANVKKTREMHRDLLDFPTWLNNNLEWHSERVP